MRTKVRCPGLPYPDYTEIDRLLAAGWKVVDVRADIADSCVWLTMEKEGQ